MNDFKFIDDLLNDFAWTLDLEDDQHASAHYKRDLVRKVGKKTILNSMKYIKWFFKQIDGKIKIFKNKIL